MAVLRYLKEPCHELQTAVITSARSSGRHAGEATARALTAEAQAGDLTIQTEGATRRSSSCAAGGLRVTSAVQRIVDRVRAAEQKTAASQQQAADLQRQLDETAADAGRQRNHPKKHLTALTAALAGGGFTAAGSRPATGGR